MDIDEFERLRNTPTCKYPLEPSRCGADAPFTVQMGFGDEATEIDVCRIHLRTLASSWGALVRVGRPIKFPGSENEHTHNPVPSQVSGIESTPPATAPTLRAEQIVEVSPAAPTQEPLVLAIESPKPTQRVLAVAHVSLSPHQQETIARVSQGLNGEPQEPVYRAEDSPGRDFVFCDLQLRGRKCGRWIREAKVAEHMRSHNLPAIQARVLPVKKYKCERQDHIDAGCTRSFDEFVALKAHQTATKVPVVEVTRPAIGAEPFQRGAVAEILPQ